MCGRSLVGDAGAAVAHTSARRRGAGRRSSPPDGLHFAALSSRFAIARSSVAGVPTDVDRRELGVDRDAGLVARRPPDRLLGDEVEPHVLEGRLLLLAARELGELARSARSSPSSCATTSARSCSRSSGGSAPSRASTSMFVRRLVSGVRSSCDASWTSWRWRCAASSSDASIALKVVASRLSSSLAASRRSAASGRASCERARPSRQPAHRLERRARDEEARALTRRRSRRARRGQPEPDPGESVVDRVERALRSGPRNPAWRRDRVDADVRRPSTCASEKNARRRARAPPRVRRAVEPGADPDAMPAAVIAVAVDELEELREPGCAAEALGRSAMNCVGRSAVADDVEARRDGSAARAASVPSTWPRSSLRTSEVDDDRRERRPPRRPRPRRRAPAGGEGSRLAQGVADAADRVDQPRLAARLGLLAQVADVDVERVRAVAEVVAPDAVEDHRAGQHLPRVAEEELEQRELGAGQGERLVAARRPRAWPGRARCRRSGARRRPRRRRAGAGARARARRAPRARTASRGSRRRPPRDRRRGRRSGRARSASGSAAGCRRARSRRQLRARRGAASGRRARRVDRRRARAMRSSASAPSPASSTS